MSFGNNLIYIPIHIIQHSLPVFSSRNLRLQNVENITRIDFTFHKITKKNKLYLTFASKNFLSSSKFPKTEQVCLKQILISSFSLFPRKICILKTGICKIASCIF